MERIQHRAVVGTRRQREGQGTAADVDELHDAVRAKGAEAKAQETQAAETQAAETQAAETQAAETKATEKAETDAVFARALRLLAAREHSAHELSRKLLAKGHPQLVIASVLDELQVQGLQSDGRFVEVYVRSRIGRGYGPIRIRQDLYQRGVDDELIEVELTCPAERWIELANSVRGKRFGETLPDDRDAWNTQARFLARRGFPADLIYRVLGQI